MDWGTSNLRVMRLADDGRVLDQRSDDRGAGELGLGDFPRVLKDVAGGWLTEAPVMICGMAGARGRWRETRYVPCPVSVGDLAQGLEQPDGARDTYIVPGVAETGPVGWSDVMRGEETQVMGLTASKPDAWVIAPGTHSKWIRMEAGRIVALRTFVTGELFSAIRARTILAGDPEATRRDDDAFRQGVERGLSDPALSATLFSARVGLLAGRLSPETAPEYVSGLLIGTEIAAQGLLIGRSRLTVIGAPELTRRYVLALALAGHDGVQTVDGAEVAARGLWRIWKART